MYVYIYKYHIYIYIPYIYIYHVLACVRFNTCTHTLSLLNLLAFLLFCLPHV